MLEMNPDTMTLDECCDFLAKKHGWVQNEQNRDLWSDGSGHWWQGHNRRDLDSIAASLPEGWHWEGVEYWFGGVDHTDTMTAKAESHRTIGEAEGEAEITSNQIDAFKLSMARCDVKAWLQQKGTP